jgi:uncharacterized protein (DUF1015 family)
VADVRPFRAVRYARPSAEQTAPPYDVIDPEACEALRARDPHNVVHLTSETDERRAAERLERWLAEGTLVRDPTPAVWFLEQDFVGPDGIARRRKGIVASLQVEPYSAGTVLPHERTHAEALAGRLRLLRATRTQLEPIFLLYEGAPPLTRPAAEPDIDIEGTRLWRLAGDEGVDSFFRTRQLLIADGHHRYEAAVAFAAEDGADRMLVVLVSTDDPGLQVFPTHRVFAGRPEIDPPGDSLPTIADARAALDREPGGAPSAVFVGSDGPRLVRGEPGELDVELVDRFGHAGLSYTPDAEEALRRVESGEADCAFLLRPLRIADVFDRARHGRTMPPKATYFFPKLLSGLLFHPLEP